MVTMNFVDFGKIEKPRRAERFCRPTRKDSEPRPRGAWAGSASRDSRNFIVAWHFHKASRPHE